MKKILLFLSVLITALTFSACSTSNSPNLSSTTAAPTTTCVHVWSKATCKEYSHCEICSATTVGYGDHEFDPATCDTPQTCSVCGLTEGKPIGHAFLGASCGTPAVCVRCGTLGELGSHTFTGGTCTTYSLCVHCGISGALGEHSYSEPTCTEKGVCEFCSATIEALDHDLIPASCTTPVSCKRCDYTEGDPLGHNGQGKCKRCFAVLPIVGSGSGDAVLSDITLEDGIYLLHFTHNGRRNIIVHGYDATGAKDLLVNEIGDYDGVVPLYGKSPYMFNIEADGKWTYEIAKIEKTSEKSFSGKGDYVTGIFAPSNGAQVWHFKHDGKSNFVVRLVTLDGRDLVVNEIGAYDADQIITIPAGSNAFFEINADGHWEIYPK